MNGDFTSCAGVRHSRVVLRRSRGCICQIFIPSWLSSTAGKCILQHSPRTVERRCRISLRTKEKLPVFHSSRSVSTYLLRRILLPVEPYDGKINLRRQMRVIASFLFTFDRETGKAVGRTVAYACFAHMDPRSDSNEE